jgi:ArsR family transcriptional regulator
VSTENPKRRLFELFATVAKALGHGHRLELLEHLAQGERGVDGLAELSGLKIANASQHLQYLRRAGLVASRREGKCVLYRLADEAVIDLLGSLMRVAERNLAEVDRVVDGYFRDRDSFEPVTRAGLMDRSRDGLVTVLDVRPEEEFQLGHVPGAINIPLGDLERRLAELDPKQEIVAYCRGPWCVLSFEAVATLRQRGFSARRLEDGLPEWRAAGLPVERAPVDDGA